MIHALKVLSNERRLLILRWLKKPRKHFPPQRDGDLIEDGVCGQLIADKLGLSAPTVSAHMKLLVQAGLVRSKKIRQWTFYRRDEAEIKRLKKKLTKGL